MFWRRWAMKELCKGLWTNLMGGREKWENVKKSHKFYLSQLSVASGNSILCLSSFSLGTRSPQYATFVTWGKVKRKTTGGRGARSGGSGLLPHQGYHGRSKQPPWRWVCTGPSARHKIIPEYGWKGHVTATAKTCRHSRASHSGII